MEGRTSGEVRRPVDPVDNPTPLARPPPAAFLSQEDVTWKPRCDCVSYDRLHGGVGGGHGTAVGLDLKAQRVASKSAHRDAVGEVSQAEREPEVLFHVVS